MKTKQWVKDIVLGAIVNLTMFMVLLSLYAQLVAKSGFTELTSLKYNVIGYAAIIMSNIIGGIVAARRSNSRKAVFAGGLSSIFSFLIVILLLFGVALNKYNVQVHVSLLWIVSWLSQFLIYVIGGCIGGAIKGIWLCRRSEA